MRHFEKAADAIRAEARRRYLNDPLHRTQVDLTGQLIKAPDGILPESRQFARTVALITASIALVVADKEFMASLEAAAEADEAVQLVQRMLRSEPLRRIADISDMPQA